MENISSWVEKGKRGGLTSVRIERGCKQKIQRLLVASICLLDKGIVAGCSYLGIGWRFGNLGM